MIGRQERKRAVNHSPLSALYCDLGARLRDGGEKKMTEKVTFKLYLQHHRAIILSVNTMPINA